MRHNELCVHYTLLILFSITRKKTTTDACWRIVLFEIPENAPETFVHDLVEEIRQSKSIPVPPFNNRLNGLFWDEDEEFDIDHHFRHIALPHPGRIRELLVYISQQHSSLIDRAKPLWTCDIIEGIEGNRFAMYFKIHHAMVDGVAGMRLIEKSLSKHHKKTCGSTLVCRK